MFGAVEMDEKLRALTALEEDPTGGSQQFFFSMFFFIVLDFNIIM